jgi:uncharacterized protein
MIIRNASQNVVLADRAQMADTPAARMKGLLGRESLAAGEALVIKPCQSVHMFFMRFAIDVIFVGKDNTVVGSCPRLSPFALSPVFWKSSCAVELPAGTIEQTRTGLNDRIEFS